MERVKVESGQVHSVGHDATGLEVQFHHGKCFRRTGGDCCCGTDEMAGPIYLYPDVKAEDYAALVAAPSIGAHIHTHIRGKFVGYSQE